MISMDAPAGAGGFNTWR